MSSGFTNLVSLQALLPIITLAIYIVAIIIGLDCVWRVEKRLGVCLKLFVAGLAILTLRMIAGIIGLAEASFWLTIVWATDALAGILFLSALLIMYKIIRSLNYEQKRRK